jgi:hypothetical protein
VQGGARERVVCSVDTARAVERGWRRTQRFARLL